MAPSRRQRGGPDARLNQLEFGPNLPCFRAFQYNISQTIPNNIETPVVFDIWENGNDNVFNPHVNGSGYVDYVTALVEGVFSITFTFEWDDMTGFTSAEQTAIALEECFGCWTEAPNVTMPALPLAGNNSTGHYLFHLIRGYPPIWLHMGQATPSNAPSTPEWHVNVMQTSGTDQITTLCYLEIYLLGGTSVDTSELGP